MKNEEPDGLTLKKFLIGFLVMLPFALILWGIIFWLGHQASNFGAFLHNIGALK